MSSAPAVSDPRSTFRTAATVMLVRDGASGVEVFLMERSGFGPFGGLHVFPGGKVDATDHDSAWHDVVDGFDDDAASAHLGLDEGGLGYWVACIRECFEEAGVLLATDASGRLLPLADPERRARFADWRDRINGQEEGAFETMCRAESLRLVTDRLAYVSHWITPRGQPARFDTRFFVARAPAEQEALHDGFEAVESIWMRPEIALARHAKGELRLISPTISNLEAISGFDSTSALLAAKRAVDPATIPMIRPRIRAAADGAPDTAFDEVIEVIGHGGRRFDAIDPSEV